MMDCKLNDLEYGCIQYKYMDGWRNFHCIHVSFERLATKIP